MDHSFDKGEYPKTWANITKIGKTVIIHPK